MKRVYSEPQQGQEELESVKWPLCASGLGVLFTKTSLPKIVSLMFHGLQSKNYRPEVNMHMLDIQNLKDSQSPSLPKLSVSDKTTWMIVYSRVLAIFTLHDVIFERY